MPIIPQLSQAVKIGKTSSGGLPAEASASIDGVSQAQIASSSLQPVPGPTVVIPVIPFGLGLAIVMTKIEALMFKSFEDLSGITNKLLQLYETQKAQAIAKRETAKIKLYNNLINKQKEIKEELQELEQELDEINKTIPELEKEQNDEMEKYQTVVYAIKEKAKAAEEEGRIQESEALKESIHIHDDWLAEIIKISVEIITLKLRLPSLEREIQDKKYLAEMSITQNWDTNVDLADLFEVAVPPYPDLPNPPSLPTAPPIPKESEFIKAMRKAYTKWLVTPTILPTGVALAGILLYIQSQATAPPQLAAKIESSADASILSGAGLI